MKNRGSGEAAKVDTWRTLGVEERLDASRAQPATEAQLAHLAKYGWERAWLAHPIGRDEPGLLRIARRSDAYDGSPAADHLAAQLGLDVELLTQPFGGVNYEPPLDARRRGDQVRCVHKGQRRVGRLAVLREHGLEYALLWGADDALEPPSLGALGCALRARRERAVAIELRHVLTAHLILPRRHSIAHSQQVPVDLARHVLEQLQLVEAQQLEQRIVPAARGRERAHKGELGRDRI